MPEREIRVALFGAGKMAMHHVKAIEFQRHARLVGIADPVPDRTRLREHLSGDVPIYSNAEELLELMRPDVVHVCTPPETHAGLAVAAIKSGAHVYVEKPFALSVQEAEEVITLADASGLKICAGHQLLFEQPALKAQDHLPKLGKIVHVESYFSFRPVRRSSDGRVTISPLEQLVDILPHPVYLLLHFLKAGNEDNRSRPTQIRALDVNPHGSVHGILRCGDVAGTLVVTLEGRPVESYIRVVGTNGSLLADFVRGTVVVLPGPGVSGISKAVNPYSHSWQTISETSKALLKRVTRKQKSYPGLAEIVKAFYENIAGNSPTPIRNSSILETVGVCAEIVDNLKVSVSEENAKAEIDLKRAESQLLPPDTMRGAVLVTGGTGMLGRAVAAELRGRGWPVRAIGRKVPPASMRIPGIEYAAVDLGVKVDSTILKDISIVVHCAAETAGGKEAHVRNSVDATRNLIDAMAMAGVKRLVHISSIAVLKTSREIGGPVDENTPLALDDENRGPYVWGKAESERLAQELTRHHGIGIRVIRPGPLVDYNDFEAPGRLGREVERFFILVGSRKSPLHVCDVKTAAGVVHLYLENFDSMPINLNLIESNPPARGDLVKRLMIKRPDLKVVRLPIFLLWSISPAMKLLQLLYSPGKRPVNIFTIFSSEKYKSFIAEEIIKKANISCNMR